MINFADAKCNESLIAGLHESRIRVAVSMRLGCLRCADRLRPSTPDVQGPAEESGL